QLAGRAGRGGAGRPQGTGAGGRGVVLPGGRPALQRPAPGMRYRQADDETGGAADRSQRHQGKEARPSLERSGRVARRTAATARRHRRLSTRRTTMAAIEIKVPDIGDYSGVPVIELLVAVGDTVK